MKAVALQPAAKPLLFAATEDVFFNFVRYSELDLRQDPPSWLHSLSANSRSALRPRSGLTCPTTTQIF